MGRGRSKGFTLIEVVVSMLLTAVVASSVFSLALSTKRRGTVGLRKLLADQAARQVSENLKNFVSGDITTYATPNIPGPSQGAANAWSMTNGAVGDDCGGNDDVPRNCYALALGSHSLKGYLPAWFEADTPFKARVKYHVTDTLVAGVPQVTVTVAWTELP